MEQIQQHEWVGKAFHAECANCGTTWCIWDEYDGTTSNTYQCKNGAFTEQEPACITRPINAPLRNADK